MTNDTVIKVENVSKKILQGTETYHAVRNTGYLKKCYWTEFSFREASGRRVLGIG